MNFLMNILPFNNREDMPVYQYIIKKMLAFLLCLFGSGIICEVFIIAAMMAIGKDPLHGDMFSGIVMEMIMYYGYIAVIGLIFIYWKFIEKKTLSELGFTKHVNKYFIGWALAAVILGISVGLIIMTGAMHYNGVFSSIDVPLIILYFGAFVFQGIYEEVLCRGILLMTLRRKLSIPLAVTLSSLPFILLHISSMGDGGIYMVLGIANLVAISVIFSMLTISTGSIWASCGLHSFWNFSLYNLLGLNLSGNDGNTSAVFDITTQGKNILNGGDYGIEASLITLIILVISSVILIIFYKKKISNS